MDIQEIKTIYVAHPHIKAAMSLFEENNHTEIVFSGLIGSAEAVIIASLFEKKGGVILCMQNDLEDAGYFYNDLMHLMNNKDVYFFPSAYHRHIKYGHIDPANEILRTEVLGLLQTEKPYGIIVSYPDAIAEKVLSKKALQDNTLAIHAGEKIDPMFVSDVLDNYGFEQTDYVYEPGQYAMRGSIVDIFSFSNEYPFRVDFFGNEVETIRRFDVETQLSKDKLSMIYIIPEISKHNESGSSLFDSLPVNTLYVSEDIEWSKERIDGLWNETPVNRDNEGFTNTEAMRKRLITAESFISSAARFGKIHFHAKAIPGSVTIKFDTSPQPLYQKNFDLVSDSFKKYMSEGFIIYLLTDSAKQAERIRDIFDDRGDNIVFTAVNHTIHNGYTDNNLKISS